MELDNFFSFFSHVASTCSPLPPLTPFKLHRLTLFLNFTTRKLQLNSTVNALLCSKNRSIYFNIISIQSRIGTIWIKVEFSKRINQLRNDQNFFLKCLCSRKLRELNLLIPSSFCSLKKSYAKRFPRSEKIHDFPYFPSFSHFSLRFHMTIWISHTDGDNKNSGVKRKAQG